MKKLIEEALITVAMILSFCFVVVLMGGCGHNINVQGFGIACPYGAMGYGTFSCVKENVTVENTEETTKEGIKTTNRFVTGDQVNGYDVEKAKVTVQ